MSALVESAQVQRKVSCRAGRRRPAHGHRSTGATVVVCYFILLLIYSFIALCTSKYSILQGACRLQIYVTELN